MNLVDVNILVYAHRADFAEHESARSEVDAMVNGTERFGVPEAVLQRMVRVSSNLRPLATPVAESLDFCNAIKSSPLCEIIYPSENHWAIYEKLCRAGNLKGKIIADAYLAAFAIDRGAIWITADSDYEKFAGLRWRLLGESQVRTNLR